jgi:hypothetical protein
MAASQPTGRWVAPAALVVSAIAIGLAIWALVRPSGEPAASPGEPAANGQQSEDAKAGVCVAFDRVRKAVSSIYSDIGVNRLIPRPQLSRGTSGLF